MVGHAKRDPEYDAIAYFADTPSPRTRCPTASSPDPLLRKERTCTCVASAMHMLQRVHRDRNERARAFPTRAGVIRGGQSEESGGQQHGQGGGVGIDLRINAD